MKIYFYLRGKSKTAYIYVRLSGGTVKQGDGYKAISCAFGTGIKLTNPDLWVTSRAYQGCKGISSQSQDVNHQLFLFKEKLLNIYNQLSEDGGAPSVDMIRDFLLGRASSRHTVITIARKRNARIITGRDNIITFISVWKLFLGGRDDTDLKKHEWTYSTKGVFESFWMDLSGEFVDFLREKYAPASVVARLNALKSILKYAQEKEGIQLNDIWKRLDSVKYRAGDPDVLPYDVYLAFLTKYHDIKQEIGDEYTPHLQYIIVGLTTALRRIDLISLNNDNYIKNPHGLDKIMITTKKRKEPVVIPVPKIVSEIMDGNLIKTGRILPRISYSNGKLSLLKGIKKIIRHVYPAINFTPTPHTLRRTAATVMLSNRVNERVIKNIGGWTSDSRSFERYVRLAEKFRDDEITDFYERLIPVKSKQRALRGSG